MATLTDGIDNNNDKDLEYYGIEIEPEVVLPNFNDVHKTGARTILGIIDRNLPKELLWRSHVLLGTYKFGFEELQLCVKVDLANASRPIMTHVDNYFEMARRNIDGIRDSLRQSVTEELTVCGDSLTAFSAGLIVLRLLEETTSYIREYRKFGGAAAGKSTGKYWDLNTTTNIAPLLDHKLGMLGVDLDTVQGAATSILGKTPSQICNDILPDWRILHCENILRNDLRTKFLQYQAELRRELMALDVEHLKACVPRQHQRAKGEGTSAKEQIIEYLTKPRIAFHGTRREVVPCIVQHGFLKPGSPHPLTKKPLSIVNGAAYGQGIYCSPEAWYAFLYSSGQETALVELPGRKLLVCAVITGRTAMVTQGCNWWDKSKPFPGADSNVNPSGLAYILFNNAQILPCYVLHLDWAQKNQDAVWDYVSQISNHRTGKRSVPEPNGLMFSGDKARQKQELIAKGMKFFAYGFGPVSRKKLVIEDVAEIDDHEEEYGEYQAKRIEIQSRNANFWDWGKLDGESALDEYAEARKAKIRKKAKDEDTD
ncbi:uncharacterized protein BDR25DRAFT_381508 [Lindgomyces ingoldianus]|uniref:Uncharacterized protein n=1 Tax=Lindgomyces ingoldianus TaxID=673940 RepID=A0ACB6QBE7_9PLEO|nr:uncharacterized protein BDR25DRAFT_381508 [Lindgomyces ingoldianus]KAF2464369.1 hypothetical protein BDR25DRAFT_381508 [Lindgomyces ingoldianus]